MKVYLPSYVVFPAKKNLTFDAQVEIGLDIAETTGKIVLNMKDLKVKRAELFVNGSHVGVERIVLLNKSEMIKILPTVCLHKGDKVALKLTYTGTIKANVDEGLHQTAYFEKDGVAKVAVSTHLEPTHARKMVPCFDEPEFKACWNVTIIHPRETKAISNMNEEKRTVVGEWMITKFARTPLMSSYLLAIVVSEFVYIQDYTKSGVLLRVWSRKETVELAHFALQAGIKCLDFYEKLLNYKFPLEKLDMVALPTFKAGAMENWGLMMFSESNLLYDRHLHDLNDKLRIVRVIAHELAHQWFGNLITMKWWEDVWLNEGFSTYFEFLGADQLSKSMRMEDFRIVDSVELSLTTDSSGSHPLLFALDRIDDLPSLFDDITYDKGGAILKMVATVVGRDNFLKSIHHYINKFAYSTAKTRDFEIALNEAIGGLEGFTGSLKMGDFVDQWATQSGYPLVTVESFNGTHVKIRQELFRTDITAQPPKRYQWDVPIWYRDGSSSVKFQWLKRGEPLYLKLAQHEHPIIINAGRNGYYRQNYDIEGWRKISKQLRVDHKKYSAFTRNAILSDAFAAARIGKIPYEIVFELLKYMEAEKEYLPWRAAIDGISEVLSYLRDLPESEYLERFMLNLLEPLYRNCSLGSIASKFENEGFFAEVFFERYVINTFCKLGSIECKANYRNLFEDEIVAPCDSLDAPSQCATVAAPLRASTYCYGVEEGGDTALEKVKHFYMGENVQVEKDRLLNALGCQKKVPTLKKWLLHSLLSENVSFSHTEIRSIILSMKHNRAGPKAIFEFLVENRSFICDRKMQQRENIELFLSSAILAVHSKQQIEQLMLLEKSLKCAKEFGFAQAITNAERRIKWLNKHLRGLSKFLKSATHP
ncbi:unnamed protein product [Cylicocyclus nassatus]|uniref:Aminopeptidase n=1 Tax=Cylicocyclus nassatus TaxID=53992 RepID=A0AA36DML2_CYLNA|nr:unnamed protein product [Cylicocyclus nassatus]